MINTIQTVKTIKNYKTSLRKIPRQELSLSIMEAK